MPTDPIDSLPLACGCPPDTRVRQVSECEVECEGCGLITC